MGKQSPSVLDADSANLPQPVGNPLNFNRYVSKQSALGLGLLSIHLRSRTEGISSFARLSPMKGAPQGTAISGTCLHCITLY